MGLFDNKPKAPEPAKVPEKKAAPKADLTPGQLKEDLQVLEVKLLEAEEKVQLLKTMKSENEALLSRAQKLNTALYGLLLHAYRPADPALLKVEIAMMNSDLQEFYSRGKKN